VGRRVAVALVSRRLISLRGVQCPPATTFVAHNSYGRSSPSLVRKDFWFKIKSTGVNFR